MFLNFLDNDEKHAFAELAERMIKADGLVIEREEAALAALKAEMGIAGSEPGDRSVEELAGVFTRWSSKVAALLELLGLAFSDTSFSTDEQSLITKAAREMGLTADELDQLEEWVREHVQLMRRALILMRE